MVLPRLAIIFFALLLVATLAMAQNRSTGAIKGKVRVESGTPGGVAVIIRVGEREVGKVNTDKNGQFLIPRLSPGTYGLTFRKPGLSIGTIENVEVRAGKTRSLGDRLILTVDEGSIAFIRGSVFTAEGRSVARARVELARIKEDGSAKKIDGRLTSDDGRFVFRLPPEVCTYRLTATINGAETVSKNVEIDGAAVYRVALSLPAAKSP